MDIEIKPFDEGHIAVSFPNGFDSRLLNAVRSVPGRIWDGKEKLWLLPSGKQTADTLLSNLYETGLFNMDSGFPDGTARCSPYGHELQKIREQLKVRNYSDRTAASYEKWISAFLEAQGCSPDLLGQQHINSFLTDLAVRRHVSPSTQNQALAALLFYFRFVRQLPPVIFHPSSTPGKSPASPSYSAGKKSAG